MTTVNIDFTLSGSSFTSTKKPGEAPSAQLITLNQGPPKDVKTDVLESGNPDATLQWTLGKTPISAAEPNKFPDWQNNTYLVALVFGIQLIEPLSGAPSSWTASFSPAEMLKPSSGSTLQPSSHTWADNVNTVSGSAFTYLVPPPPDNGNWKLDVKWPKVKGSGLVKSYKNADKPALALKYRAYCYTTSFGLWYVDPELDLCPQ